MIPEKVTLLACPLCGGEACIDIDCEQSYAKCLDCECFGPARTSATDAAEAWNRRAESRAEGRDMRFVQGRCGHVRLASEKECPACKASEPSPENETTDEYLDRIIMEHGAKIAAKMKAEAKKSAAGCVFRELIVEVKEWRDGLQCQRLLAGTETCIDEDRSQHETCNMCKEYCRLSALIDQAEMQLRPPPGAEARTQKETP